VGNFDGSGTASTLFSDEGPCGVAIDPAAGRIYWANFYSGGPTPAIARSAWRSPGGKVYWAALDSGQIRYGNPDGTNASALFSGEHSPGALAVDPGAGKIYWANF